MASRGALQQLAQVKPSPTTRTMVRGQGRRRCLHETGPPHVTASAATPKPAAARRALQHRARPLRGARAPEMLDGSSAVRWADVAGLEAAKRTLKEAVVLPNLSPRTCWSRARGFHHGGAALRPAGDGQDVSSQGRRHRVQRQAALRGVGGVLNKQVRRRVGKNGHARFFRMSPLLRRARSSVIFLDEVDSLLLRRAATATRGAPGG